MPGASVLEPGFSVPHVRLTTETDHCGPSTARQTWISKHRASRTHSAAVSSLLAHLDPTRTSDLELTKVDRDTGGNSLASLHPWAPLLFILPSPPPSSPLYDRRPPCGSTLHLHVSLLLRFYLRNLASWGQGGGGCYSIRYHSPVTLNLSV